MRVSPLALALVLAGCLAGAEVPRVATLSVGQWPEDLVFDPGSGRVFVADEGSATVTVLSATGERIGTIRLMSRARHLAVDSALGRVYAPNEGHGFVAVFDTRTLREVSRIPAGPQPHGIAVDSVAHRVFVANEGNGSITALDGRSGQVLFTVPVG